eukprot:snap_masked-scaffold_66-processed-gene-0.56-mRNA-1 protein AED:1.00 eAED:1.00 QI:0/0/0/0/1/1/2/0/77
MQNFRSSFRAEIEKTSRVNAEYVSMNNEVFLNYFFMEEIRNIILKLDNLSATAGKGFTAKGETKEPLVVKKKNARNL